MWRSLRGVHEWYIHWCLYQRFRRFNRQAKAKGLPVRAFEQLRNRLDIHEKMLASTVNIAYRTLSRRKREGRIKTDESERVLRIAKPYEKAVDVLEKETLARQWFKLPAKALGGKTSLEYADTEPGADEVGDLLGRMEYGVFS